MVMETEVSFNGTSKVPGRGLSGLTNTVARALWPQSPLKGEREEISSTTPNSWRIARSWATVKKPTLLRWTDVLIGQPDLSCSSRAVKDLAISLASSLVLVTTLSHGWSLEAEMCREGSLCKKALLSECASQNGTCSIPSACRPWVFRLRTVKPSGSGKTPSSREKVVEEVRSEFSQKALRTPARAGIVGAQSRRGSRSSRARVTRWLTVFFY